MSTILIVDDSAVDRRLVGGLLEKDSRVTIQYAANGSEALEKIKEHVPDLVLTDLLMPEMDGLELVTTIRIQYPEVPVILMTAHGSEAIAIKALDQGAASYVPKTQLAQTVVETVEQALAIVQADRSYQRLIDCATRTEFAFSLDNDATLVDPLVDLVQQIVAGMGLCDATGRYRVGVALKEALLNAVYRGNLEITFAQTQEAREKLLDGESVSLAESRAAEPPYCDRKVFVDIRISPEEAHFVVRDEGPGFDVGALPAPGDPEALERECGRGIILMRAFMDEVTYNETGCQVTMIKRRERRDAGEK